ncbi:MAG TPA: protein kinase [Thermoguttaceae bacterium]|nr:protein kinase [Thermoguttaceae bacterium]
MSLPSAEKVAQRAFDLGLLDERQLQQVWSSFGSRNVQVDDFLQTLVRREFMTNYQVERLVKGERTGFFFGKYKVLYLVGSGTFARVYRAVHQETEQVVAVKVLRNRFSDSPVHFNQFVREGRVGCSLRHPNIVPIYDVISSGRTHFLVMEFVEGRNLREFVKIRRKLDSPEAIRLMTGIVEGMQYAFEHGLTHRDLKMNNVLVSSRREVKLVDFGLAAMDETLNGDSLAELPNARTIDYAALERATGVRKDDTRSDIYFLGCIFYNMLVGQPPLSETKDRLQRLSKSRFLGVRPIRQADPTIPDSVALVVNKAMSLDPNRRYQSPRAMLTDLELAAARLAGEGDAAFGGLPSEGAQAGNRLSAAAVEKPKQYAVMIVESDPDLQEVFRNGFKRAGYRVLLTSDPYRALDRLRQDTDVADCVVFNGQKIGESVLDAFNTFGEDARTALIPAVLLLDASQRAWEKDAVTAAHRIVLRMPITMKKLRTVLAKMVRMEVGETKKF